MYKKKIEKISIKACFVKKNSRFCQELLVNKFLGYGARGT